MKPIRLITQPTVIVLAEQRLDLEGLNALYDYVGEYRPECLPEPKRQRNAKNRGRDLFPHLMAEGPTSDNEFLVELAGRNCYYSYGAKAGKKANRDYIAHTQAGTVPHRSVMYHAKMTFFVAGVSRHLSHELIRHYVGSDRDQEGSPSQESTRYTEHTGHFVVPPAVAEAGSVAAFAERMQSAYGIYLDYIAAATAVHEAAHGGKKPLGLARKRIYEAASSYLPQAAATSFVWTSNPIALNKMFQERGDESSAAEFQRLTATWRTLCEGRWAGLFPTRG